MSEAINMHKRIAMTGESEANHLKKGGTVKKYAKGGSVNKGAISESHVANLPAKGAPLKPNMTSGKEKIATMKKGGHAVRKGAARGR